jgi:hypothetical protein
MAIDDDEHQYPSPFGLYVFLVAYVFVVVVFLLIWWWQP